MSIKFISACCKHGQLNSGLELGGTYIQQFFKNYPFKTVKNLKPREFDYKKLYETHYKSLNENSKPANKIITIGGDSSISIATVASSAKKFGDDLSIIWIDAHADINTRKSSLYGNPHEMPVASLIDLNNIYGQEVISPKQIIYVGLRDLDDFEVETLEKLNIKNYTSDFIRKYSMMSVIEDIYSENYINKVHLTFDVDVLDPTIFQSTGTPVDGGIDIREAKNLLKAFESNWVSADFVEFNPSLGENPEQNAFIVRDLIQCIV